ncbi:hypothetical protein PHYBOEH_004468 [Phytophthora boehmeriae]|uniref:BRCT domain-containing protein n=1 Tax=Phytophthora boehmeriae TaxID=109152 RepID=A0A8T1WNY1_9STRA|nr:hypothetical protein PHYBOEH_004468 [Phytophthora boehmeriae]
MFAVNGPSGPTQRNERRPKTKREREEEEGAKQRVADFKRANFFEVKAGQSKSCKPADNEKANVCGVESDIFKGCRIVFNGRTGKVSSYYLAKLVKDHGGNIAYESIRFCQKLSGQ